MITENLIKKGYVTVNYKKIKDPSYQVSNSKFYDQETYFSLNIFVQKDKISQESSLLNVFNSRADFKTIVYEDDHVKFQTPKRRKTTSHSKVSVQFTLDHLVYKAGFCNSISQAKQMIKEGHILVNGNVLKRPNFIPKKGSVLQTNHPKSIFYYFKQKYYATTLTKTVNSTQDSLKYVDYKRYFFAIQPPYLTKLDFNKVLFC